MSGVEAPPDASLDTATLRRALGCFVTGVTVVTTRDAGGAPLGFTANSFASVSLDPPLVLVCVGHEVERFDVYRRCSEFAINVLGDSQRAPLQPVRDGAPGSVWRRTLAAGGARGAHSRRLHRRAGVCDVAADRGRDHMILIGRVLRCEDSGDRPLVYWRGSYRDLPSDEDDIAHDDRSPKSSRSQP